MRFNFSFVLLILMSIGGPALALSPPMDMADAFKLSIDRAGTTATFRWQVAEGYYLYRESLQATTEDGTKLDLRTQAGEMKDDPGFGNTEVYFGQAAATLADAPQTMKLTFQGCQDGGICYPFRTVAIDGLRIEAEAPFGIRPQDPPAFQSFALIAPSAEPEKAEQSVPAPVPPAEPGMVEGFLARGGTALLLASFMGLGVLLAFTPCVFPMYPILAATLGRQGASLSPGRSFLLSSTYVVALAAAFSLFGILAAWLGQSFQIALQSPPAILITAAVFIILAIASFGMVEVQLPAGLRDRLARSQRSLGGSFGSTAILGFSSALLIGPCVTAPLAGALLYIAKSGNLLLGAAALFALGIGKGIPLILIGTSGAALLPRAGAWMAQIRWLFGFIFLATAIWYLDRLIPPSATLALSAVLLVTIGVFFGALDARPQQAGIGRRLMKSASLLSMLYGAFLAFGAASGSTSMLQPLQFSGSPVASRSLPGLTKASFATVSSNQELKAAVADAGKPSLVYFTADWCVSCRVIERSVLSNPQVAESLRDTNLVSIDLSDMTSDKQQLMKDSNVIGPPTMLFFDRKGTELPSIRMVGEISARSLIDAAAQTQQALAKPAIDNTAGARQ
ncbi:protein-disulfide reductase DsbD [Agrobacterium tumefaciens]|uniref:protein-disulfide reductase DsbD n=1 Tax=Agrobacterium tumefaciens TaxID=358 RepID=UPI001574D3A2|nr:protein-disulfide reductase DsbD [Agrobacterium tumefaciens]NTE54467.1 protein-disulfide reductase DsbD [Agrobacterium tumefaciens]NTE73315.1 protein-disulfide reductase DsbD [Agrobacterium tumefaciens]